MTRVQTAAVVGNERVCREHYRLTFHTDECSAAGAGQFVHLRPVPDDSGGYRTRDWRLGEPHGDWLSECRAPMLRRAFSIAGLERRSDGVHVDVMYRVVGTATRWLESLTAGSRLTVLGPLGNRFPLRKDKPAAWLAAGGVGLPPMLWLAEALHQAGKRTVAFCGARSESLLALTVSADVPPSVDAKVATPCCPALARHGTRAVISTDDGSLGYHGHVGAAMQAYHDATGVVGDELVVYTCGPEPMMRFIAGYCVQREIECFVCMERAMACGTGLCQSCVLPVRDESDPQGWRYRLCCTDGPVFEARRVIWEPVGAP